MSALNDKQQSKHLEELMKLEGPQNAGYIIKDSGERSEFKTGAVRDCSQGKGRYDLLPIFAIMALAKHYEAGCQKYGDRNWEKGIPLSRFTDSAERHIAAYKMGLEDEPHLTAAAWNIMCALDTIFRIELGLLPDTLDDLPRYLKQSLQDPRSIENP